MEKNDVPALKSFLSHAYQNIFDDKSGAPAGYIPELAIVNPEQFGIAITTSDGFTNEVGDSSTEFTIQSISKAFVYSLALESLGTEKVLKTIGIEPSGEAFNSIRLKEDNRPFNPMVNSGAIACTALICQNNGKEAFETILNMLSEFAGRILNVDDKVFSSESATGDRNRAIGWLLRNSDNFSCDVEEVLEVYFRQCSILVTARDLSIMGATLSNNGTNPVTKKRVVSKTTAVQTMSVMVSSGMYDYSGEWTYRVGLPAKSGVGGGITAVLPSQFGLGVFSPPLDKLGNSVRGIKVCQLLSEHFHLHILETEDDVTQNIPITYDLREIRSSRTRCRSDNETLEDFGSRVSVLELSGVINFIGGNFITRSVAEEDNKDFVVLSFTRVSRLTRASIEVFRLFFEKLLSKSQRMVVVDKADLKDDSKGLFGDITELIHQHCPCFKNLDKALEWVEDQLIAQYGTCSNHPADLLPIAEQPLLKDLPNSDLELLQQNLVSTEYESGSKIIQLHDKADGIYFLRAGKVSVMLGEDIYVAGLDAGTCFGELALIEPDAARTANIIAETKVVCSFLSIEAFNKISLIKPKLNELLLRNLGLILFERLKQSNSKIVALSAN